MTTMNMLTIGTGVVVLAVVSSVVVGGVLLFDRPTSSLNAPGVVPAAKSGHGVVKVAAIVLLFPLVLVWFVLRSAFPRR